MSDSAHLCLIYGSARDGRFCDTVARWVQDELAKQSGFTVSIVDPLEDQSVEQRNNALAQADAFIVITPEYNHSFPAALKAIIDDAKREWAAKPVAFVSYGGISGGLRAVEQLRGIFSALHAVSIREQIGIAWAHAAFDDTGQPRDKDGLSQAFMSMLDRLAWWSDALSQARAKRPYREAA